MKDPHDEGFITLHRGRMSFPVNVIYLLVMVVSVVMFIGFLEEKMPRLEKVWSQYRAADDRTRPFFVNPCSKDMITIEVTDGTFRCLSKFPLDEQPGSAWK